MERNHLLNLLLITALAQQAAACNATEPINVTPSPNVTTFVPTEPIITSTILPTEILVTPTPTLEERFRFGELDMTKTSFTFWTSDELQLILGHIANTNRELFADIPLPVKESGGNPEQNKTFEDAAQNHSLGNPYFLALSDQPNHLFAMFHSLQLNAVGDLAREIGGYVYKHPENTNQILGVKIPMTLRDTTRQDENGDDVVIGQVEAEIVFVNTVSKEFFGNEEDNFPWGINEENVLFARTDQFGIPFPIRNDTTPGVYYLTIVGCQNVNPGEISINLFNPGRAYAENTANRSLVTFKIVIPQN